jgi:hypothetical protein
MGAAPLALHGEIISSGQKTVSAETKAQPQEPAKCGLLGRLQEIFGFERLGGGGPLAVSSWLLLGPSGLTEEWHGAYAGR